MNKKFFTFTLVTMLATGFASLASADNLGQFDARSMALGGTGVAGAKDANAAAYNPALLTSESNKSSFSIIPLAVKVDAYNENDFIETIEDAEESINDPGGLDELLGEVDGLTKTTCGGKPCYKSDEIGAASRKAEETFKHIRSLNKSSALVSANAGMAVQFGEVVPAAIIIDKGAFMRVGLKFAESDFQELDAYTNIMDDGKISQKDLKYLEDLDIAEEIASGTQLSLLRVSQGKDLYSLMEFVGATYDEVGVAFADSFKISDRDFSVGILPKVVKVEAIKYHQSVEADDVDLDDITDEDNITSKTDFNSDVGITFKPLNTQPLQVGVTLKNMFSRTYELKKTQEEIDLENRVAGGDANAQIDLANFNFTNDLKIEPQLTAGVLYQFPMINLLADLDLNEAEILGRTSQNFSMGAEFDARFASVQVGYRTSIGGDDEDDTVSAGFGLGPLKMAGVFTGDHIGGVVQFSFSF